MPVGRGLPLLVATVALLAGGTACGSGGGSGKSAVGAYCAKAQVLEGAAARLSQIDRSDKAAVKSTLKGVQADAHSALKQAPTVIRKDADVVVRDIDDLVDVVDKAGYDVKKVSTQDLERISNQGTDAQTRVTEYNQKTCGILPPDVAKSGGQPGPTATTGVGGG